MPSPRNGYTRRSTVWLLLLAALLLLALSAVLVTAEDVESADVEAQLPEVVAEAVVVEASVDADTGAPIEVAIEADVVLDNDEDEMDEETARKIMEEAEANAERVAAAALAASSIKEPLIYEGVGRIHDTAKVHPEGCAAVTREYLNAMSTRATAANEMVRRARADVNEARSHTPAKLSAAEKALAQAESTAEETVMKVMREFGGDVPKTCIQEVADELNEQFTRAMNMESRYLATWTRHFSILQGSAMLMGKTGEGVVQHLVDLWQPTYDAIWDFVYAYTERAQSQFNEARSPTKDGSQPDFLTYLTFCARGFGYALVPILTVAVGVWVLFVFWPLLLVGVFAPPFIFQVWWRVFILWNMYALSYPKGYFSALSEYKTMFQSGQYEDALSRAADAFFDVIGEDAGDSFYNGIVVMFVLWGVLVLMAVLVYVWIKCFVRCAGLGRRRHRAAPHYPARSKTPTDSSSRAGAAKPKAATKASPKASPKPATTANASKKKKN